MIKWALGNEKLSAVVIEIMNEEEMEEDLGVVGRGSNARGAADAPRPRRRKRPDLHAIRADSVRRPVRPGIPTADLSRSLVYHESYEKRTGPRYTPGDGGGRDGFILPGLRRLRAGLSLRYRGARKDEARGRILRLMRLARPSLIRYDLDKCRFLRT